MKVEIFNPHTVVLAKDAEPGIIYENNGSYYVRVVPCYTVAQSIKERNYCHFVSFSVRGAGLTGAILHENTGLNLVGEMKISLFK